MTTQEILSELAQAGKTVCPAMLYRYFKTLKITPSGASQRPQQYPPDTANRIKAHLGLNGFGPHSGTATAAGLLGLPVLKRARRAARKGAKR